MEWFRNVFRIGYSYFFPRIEWLRYVTRLEWLRYVFRNGYAYLFTIKPEYPNDVFLVHSLEDNETAQKIDEALMEKGLKTFAHYKDDEVFLAGRPMFDNIFEAVNQSKIILIYVPKTLEMPPWLLYEAVLGLKKSQQDRKMCVRLLFDSDSEKAKKEIQKGFFHYIPVVVIDFNRDDWKDVLADKLKEEVQMCDILPAGNVAHGLVFNYYIGYLQYVLPATADAVKKSEYSKKGNFLENFFIIIPESCKISPLEGHHGQFTIEKMEKPLDMVASHGDKKRPYNPSVYRITQDGSGESYFFTADVPFILATMSKMNDMGFAEIEIQLQMILFKMTLMQLVHHPGNVCKDTAIIISYKDPDESPAPRIWKSLSEEFANKKDEVANNTHTVAGQKADISTDVSEMITVTITNLDKGLDRDTAEEIENNLIEQENVTILKGENEMLFQNLQNAKWNIFILSKHAVHDPLVCALFDAVLEYSISGNKIQVVPVLAKGSDISDIPFNFKWTTILKQVEPSFLEKVLNALKAKRKMLELLPSGEVYQGLAYAYLINYLPYNLLKKTLRGRDLRERFIDAKANYNVTEPCVAKMFVIVPKSCSFPAPGSSFENEEHLGPLEAVVLGVRQYFLQMYRLTMSDGEKVCYSREYATPAIALHDMSQLPFAGLNKEEMNTQAKKFAYLSTEIMEHESYTNRFGDIRDRCEIVYFDDEELGMEGVTSVLKERLQKCLNDGNCIV